MKMSLQGELGAMEKAIADLVAVTLSNIRQISTEKDFVLDDKDGNFKTLFLNCAKSKLLTSYNAYVIEAELEDHSRTCKSNERTAYDSREKMVSQSTFYDDEDDDFEAKGSTDRIPISNSLNPFVSKLADRKCSLSENQQFPISRQSFRQASTTTDISEIQKDAELQLQNQFHQTLHVRGLPIRGAGDRNSLLSVFISLCNYLLVPVDPKEVDNIESDGETLMVTFHQKHKRDLVLMSAGRNRNLKNDDILELLPGEIPMRLEIHKTATVFYKHLSQLAHNYVLTKQLNSYEFCRRGLGIKFKAGKVFDAFVRSENELRHEIARNELNSKSLVAPPVPCRPDALKIIKSSHSLPNQKKHDINS